MFLWSEQLRRVFGGKALFSCACFFCVVFFFCSGVCLSVDASRSEELCLSLEACFEEDLEAIIFVLICRGFCVLADFLHILRSDYDFLFPIEHIVFQF